MKAAREPELEPSAVRPRATSLHPCHSPSPGSVRCVPILPSVTCLDRRDQVLLERAREIEAGRKIPIAPRRPVVDVFGPRVDDTLTLLVGRPRDLGAGE